MAATNVLTSSDVVLVTDWQGTVVLGGTPLLTNTGIIPRLGSAQMDGQVQMLAYGSAVSGSAARMDGHAQVLGVTVNTSAGAAEMDGQAQVLADSIAAFGGAARMDGQAQVAAVSVNMAVGTAQMDGRASTVVAQSVHGAGLTEMDGAASMVAVAPNVHRVTVFENLVGSDATSVSSLYNAGLLQKFTSIETTKVKSHYRLLSRDTFNLTGTVNNRMKFLKTVRDVTITLTGSTTERTQYHYGFTTSIFVRPTLSYSAHAIMELIQNLTMHPTTSQKFIWGRILKEAFKVSAVASAVGAYKKALAQLFKLSDIEGLRLSHPVALSQNINLSLSLAHVTNLKLLQKFLVATASSPVFHYHLALIGRVAVEGILDHFARAILTQLFTVHPALNRQFTANGSLSQLLTVSPALTNKLILEIVESSNLVLDSNQLVHMIYKGDPLLDGVAITALYVSPSGTTTTWAVNTRTNAVTEYLNYDFRSFAWMGNRYVAAGSDGLYELDGDTDDGASIIAEMMSGYLQLNEKKMFGIKGAYVAIRGGGRFYLKLISGDGREYVYELRAQPNLMTTKVKVGKGLKTTYMAFDLVTEGQDFDLDSIEFIPMTSGRRV